MDKTNYNPGENVVGQECRAKKHHEGPIDKETYLKDSDSRSQSQSKRLKTIENKIQEVSKKSGTKILMKYITETGRVKVVKTDNWTEEEKAEQNSIQREAPQAEVQATYPAPVQPQQPSTSTGSRKRHLEEENEDRCKICNKGAMRKGKGDIWVQCEFSSHGISCKYWVHSVCTGFLVEKEKDLDKLKFYCPVHIRVSKIRFNLLSI